MAILVAGLVIWRLFQGPIELDRLTPYVQQALEQAGAGVGVALSGVSVGIDHDTHQLDLRVRDVRLAAPDGAPLASFPEMAASFSVGALLRGRLEPTRLTVEHPVFRLTRDESGRFTFRIGNAGGDAGSLGLDDPIGVFTPLREGGPWSRLRRIDVRDATVTVDDRLTGKTWRANRVAGSLERGERGVDGALSLAVVLGGNAPELHATYRYAAAAQKLDVQVALDGLDPAALAAMAPALAPLDQAKVPVSGTLGLRFDLAAGRAERVRLDLDFGAGQWETKLLPGGSLPIVRGELHADYVPDSGELRLQGLALDLGGGSRLAVSGRLGEVAPSLLVPQLIVAGAPAPAKPLVGSLDVALTGIPTARLEALWPQGVARGGKRWATANLADGMVDEVSMRLAVAADPATLVPKFSGAHGTMRFHDLTINYFNGLPPVRKVSGTASLADRRLDFAFADGEIKALKATAGTVVITDLGAPVETMTVDLALAGPLQDALEIIDSKPLRYAHEAGADPARIGGKVDMQLHFKLPLLDALKLDQVDYGAKATLTGASYARIALDKALTAGSFALDLGRTGVHVEGGGRFDGTPATIDANLYFHPKSGPRAKYRIALTLDDEARRRLDWDFAGDRIGGPVACVLTYTVPAAGSKAEVDAALDLRDARLAIDEAGWKKPRLVPASAKLAIELDNDAVVRVPLIEVKAPGLDSRSAVTLSADRKRIERVDIRRLAVGDSDLAGSVARRPGGGWRADIRAARLDLSREIKQALSDDTPASPAPLQIQARVGRLVLGPQREARDVAAELLRDRGSWQSIKIDGHYPSGRKLTLTVGGNGAGQGANRHVRFESDDLGTSLALFGIADNVVGGHVTLDGMLTETAGRNVLHARIDGGDYALARAPVLARLLSLASFEGLIGMMSGSGIPFTKLRGELTYAHGRIGLDRLLAFGGALGVTANGWIDPQRSRIDIAGTLAPAYALNSILGNFPVLGSLLMGGEGQSLFAASFRLTGSSDDPSVAVNPLSAVTPGILRHLFDPFMGAPAAAEPDAAR